MRSIERGEIFVVVSGEICGRRQALEIFAIELASLVGPR